MRKLLLLAALFALLSGCSTYAPGEDAQGTQLQVAGIKVLTAVRNYMDDTVHPPHTLQDLIPKYLDKLPDQPKIDYDFKNSVLSFNYIQGSGANSILVTCHALVGQVDWVCD